MVLTVAEDTCLMLLPNTEVNVTIITAGKGRLTDKDISKFNSQYPKLTLRTSNNFHDRFLILDKELVYHIGASIKDAGKKSFGITRIEDKDLINSLLSKILTAAVAD
jgi:hypothetical protein